MDARVTAGRIALAVTGLAIAASLVPLVPFGLTRAPLASVALLVVGPLLVFWVTRRLLAQLPRDLARLSGAVDAAEPSRAFAPPPTSEPRIATLAVAIDRRLHSLGVHLRRHRDARLEAEEEDKSETEFLTELSHELRTPLNSILGFSDVLLDEIDGPLTPSQREDVETIRASGQHLSALVDDVIDMAALHSGQVKLDRRPLDLAPIVVEVERLLRAQLRDKMVVLASVVVDTLPTIEADQKRIRQILMNLGTNALKFTEAGEVRIEAIVDGDGVRLSVHDTGPGIPPSERGSIFHEFTQVSGSVLRRTQGSGLGLAIVKRLTELHGGRIWLDSVTGEGSSFHVWLPASGRER